MTSPRGSMRGGAGSRGKTHAGMLGRRLKGAARLAGSQCSTGQIRGAMSSHGYLQYLFYLPTRHLVEEIANAFLLAADLEKQSVSHYYRTRQQAGSRPEQGT